MTAAWVTCAALAALAQACPPLGHEAWTAAHAWWDARHYERAAADGDWRRMRALGLRLLDRTGDSGPLQMAAYRMGVAAASPAIGRPDPEAEAWARHAVATLEEQLHRSRDPWSDRSLQCFILLQRVLPRSGDPEDRSHGLARGLAWLASGGGPASSGARIAEAYRRYLAAPPDRREHVLAQLLDAPPADAPRD